MHFQPEHTTQGYTHTHTHTHTHTNTQAESAVVILDLNYSDTKHEINRVHLKT